MAVAVSDKEVSVIGEILSDSSLPLKDRFRALFTLRNIGGKAAIEQMARAFDDSSALLKHELAYCLGQLRDPLAVPFLVQVLKNPNQDAIVRHEAAEALGAIADPLSFDLLQEYSRDDVTEVAETCQLALQRLQWMEKEGNRGNDNFSVGYSSVDPAPPDNCGDVEELRRRLLDRNINLYDRYRAMFSLRNNGSPQAVAALCEGLKCPSSALFRHEVAFVLGQMQRTESVDALIESLQKMEESEMVRHECAEALGSIGTDRCERILHEYLNDDKRVVRESCEIALDIYDYGKSNNFQYADVLQKLRSGEYCQ